MMKPFFAALIRNPKQIGAIVPSGMPLAKAMAEQVPACAQTVLELGPGTGSITRALLGLGLHPLRLMLVEKESDMAAGLARRFPGAEVLQGDATQLARLLRARGIQQVDAVVSSLPLLSMKPIAVTRILVQAFAALRPGGVFVQYTYSPVSPVSRCLVERLGLAVERAAVVFRNLPPATVWVYGSPCPLIADSEVVPMDAECRGSPIGVKAIA
jgi:phosphatidylethanolamine/phosphatidyl-N-methylethanolamine N-methyltransferase